MEFKLSIFRFNPKSDYLPYYKKYTVNIQDDLKLSDLLEKVKKEDLFFEYPKEKRYIIVNKYVLDINTILHEVACKFGNELILDPLSSKRSIKDLVINTDDFDKIFCIFKGIVDDSQKSEYDKYLHYFYASPALKYDEGFQGTSLFLFADAMIKKYPEKEEEILKIISDKNHGIWYHYPLNYKIFPKDDKVEEIVGGLKSKIYKMLSNTNPILEKISTKLVND